MKEIKFRVWHKKKRKMSLPFGFGDLYGYEGEVNAVTLRHPYVEEDKNQDFTITRHIQGAPGYPKLRCKEGIDKDLVFMQYIGLKDKNDKEIFEGDIVERYPGKPAVIGFFSGIIEDHYEGIDNDYTGFALLGEYEDLTGISQRLMNNYKIIGNIWETPELSTSDNEEEIK